MSRFLLTLAVLLLSSRAQPQERQRTLARMSVSDKLAQLLFVGFEDTRVTPDLRHLVADWHVGGVVLYGQNVESPEQVGRLNHDIAALADEGVAPFIAVDQEGGIVRRLYFGVPQLPGAMALGATRSPGLAREAASKRPKRSAGSGSP